MGTAFPKLMEQPFFFPTILYTDFSLSITVFQRGNPFLACSPIPSPFPLPQDRLWAQVRANLSFTSCALTRGRGLRISLQGLQGLCLGINPEKAGEGGRGQAAVMQC